MSPLRVRVYLEDTDAGGIVYHVSYLRFLERARTEAFRQADVQQSQTFGADLAFVVHTMQLEFLIPAVLDAQLDITCELGQCKGARLQFAQEVRDADTAVVHCRAAVSVACITLSTKRPRRVPPEMLVRFRTP